jgi:hypothetical protein
MRLVGPGFADWINALTYPQKESSKKCVHLGINKSKEAKENSEGLLNESFCFGSNIIGEHHLTLVLANKFR